MIACSLIKPESTLDQVKKTFPKLKPTDAALLAIATVLSGRYALANYNENQYEWPHDYEKLTTALMGELEIIQQNLGGTTKKKAAADEEAPQVNINLIPNYAVAEQILGDRDDLKKLLSDMIQEGVDYNYTPNDVGWQWALDRANWRVLSKGEFTHRVSFVANFPEVVKKKRTTKKKEVVK